MQSKHAWNQQATRAQGVEATGRPRVRQLMLSGASPAALHVPPLSLGGSGTLLPPCAATAAGPRACKLVGFAMGESTGRLEQRLEQVL